MSDGRLNACKICFAEFPEPAYWFHTRTRSITVCDQCGRAACAIADAGGMEFALLGERDQTEGREPSENPFVVKVEG